MNNNSTKEHQHYLFEAFLQIKGYSVTKERVELFDNLYNHREVTIKQLIDLLPSQNTSTIYRNINLFQKLGIIHRIQLGWHSKLELSDKFQRHHHHLVCTVCKTVFNLPEDEIQAFLNDIGRQRDFRITSHQLEVQGICYQCQQLST